MNFPAKIEEASVSSLYSVAGMRCAACISRIENGLPKTPGIQSARVNLSARRVRVDHDPAVHDDAILAAFRAVGFDAHPFAGELLVGEKRSDESRQLMLALAVAGFAAMNIMLLSVSVWSGATGDTRNLFHWVSALIAVPAVTFAGRPFFRSALQALSHGRTNMDVPISIGVILTIGMSLYETATGGPHAYFDGAVMLLFFLLAGRYLDSLMRARAQDSVAALLRRVPGEATVVDGGAHARRRVEELMPGDTLLVAAGERIGADGEVKEGSSEVDQSLVTGESLPVRIGVGASVLAGTINLARPIMVRASAVGEGTSIAAIARLMEAAGQSKSALVTVADRAARLYAPAVHSLAALSFLGWWLAGAGVHQALLIATAVLIITCPCALGLAVPIAQVVAAGSLMRAGILLRTGDALERMASVDVAFLDKTGTATLGRLEPSNLPDDLFERSVLAALARSSRHPLSRAVTCALEHDDAATMDEIEEIAGFGVQGQLNGRAWRFGRPDWVGARECGDVTVAAFGPVGGPVHLITFCDALRPDAARSMIELRAAFIQPALISGDRPTVVEKIAHEMGIMARAQVTPAEKDSLVRAEQAQNHHVLMVGDGLNDGPAMKSADVAMAPAAASDVGQMSADFLFFSESLRAVPIAVRASCRSMRIVKQNFAIAVAYNTVAVPLAIAGLVTPLIAALAMSGSSILVVANSMRLHGAAK
jgi:Cu2+-exporting ATPase